MGRTTESPTSPAASEQESPTDWGKLGGTDHAYIGEGPTVVILGDSLVMMSRKALRADLKGTSSRLAGRAGEGLSGGGQSTAWGKPLMLTLAKDLRDSNPDVTVIALGTNDALSPALGLPAAIDAWNKMTQDLSGSCLVAVTVSETSKAENFSQHTAKEINKVMRRDADVIVDWNALGSSDRYTRPDDIHPTPLGQAHYAKLIRQGIDECLAPPKTNG